METPEVLLTVIAVTLVVICITLWVVMRRMMPSYFTRPINATIERLGEATRHYTEVNAILALTEQFKSRPDLVERLNEFGDQTVAAALMVRMNGVANDIKVTQTELTRWRKKVAEGYANSYQKRITEAEQQLKHLQEELEMLADINRQRGALIASAIN